MTDVQIVEKLLLVMKELTNIEHLDLYVAVARALLARERLANCPLEQSSIAFFELTVYDKELEIIKHADQSTGWDFQGLLRQVETIHGLDGIEVVEKGWRAVAEEQVDREKRDQNRIPVHFEGEENHNEKVHRRRLD